MAKKEINIPRDRNIMTVPIEEAMPDNYLPYAVEVAKERALPDVRDGLKPVHRRILYGSYLLKAFPDRPYYKSARIVGDVLGKFHPHGDSSVYEAMVIMAQDFSTREPLFDGHGNFGSMDGDSAAAMRYTEARLSSIAMEMLRDIDKDTVDMVPNYSDSDFEPKVLPARYPNLLVNGTFGIAVGLATNIPPHNLGEVTDGVLACIDNPEITTEQLMEYIKAPDLPTGGILIGKKSLLSAYETGEGKVTLRAKTSIETLENGRLGIVITEFPYRRCKAKLLQTISEMTGDKKHQKVLESIVDIRDESDRECKVRIVIELKRDVNAQVILNQLYKHTQLQDTFGVIMLALVNGEPKILTLRQCLDHYIDHRKVVILRRTQFDLDKALARAHILEGLRIALDNIDEVINIIRSSYDDPKERLMKRFNLSDIQAQAILDMRLKTLSGLQREKIDEEYNELMKLIEHLRAILSSERLVYDIIKEELLEIKQKYGDERKTKIVAAEGEINIEDLVKEEQTVITLTHFGYVKRMPIDTYKSQKRGGKGITGLATREEDFVKQIFTASTHDTLLFFSNKGKLYRLRGYEIPEAGRTAKGTAIVNLLRLDPGEKISAVIPISNFADGKYLLMGTKQGFIKKTPLNEFDSSRKTGLLSITLREDDELIDVRLTDGQDNVVLVTSQGACITFSEKDVRPMGRTAQGVIGIRLDSEDCVIGMESIVEGNKNATLLAITENGFGKRTELDEYRVQTRGGKGVTTYKITPKTGSLIGIRIATDNEDVMLITDNGTIIRLKVKDISILGRSTQGVTLMRTNEGKVVSIETINPDENEGDE